MPIVVTDAWCLLSLELHRAAFNAFTPGILCGLYQGTPLLRHTMVMADLTEATFPGYYPGGQNCFEWAAPYLVGEFAYLDHPAKTWTALGGGATNLIGGWFLTATVGLGVPQLVWMQHFDDGPYLIGSAGDIVQARPRITRRGQLLQG